VTRFDVTVVGSCMTDLITTVPRMPKLGETLVGTGFHIGFGGKGANQAVMAARLGAATAMVARVGDDHFGRATIDNFRENGVDATHVDVISGVASGVAPIAVQEDGQNTVLIVPGANDRLDVAGVGAATDVITSARVVLCQLEVPEAATREAFALARRAGAITVFNPAPAAAIDDRTLALADYVLPNETELELLTGCTTDSLDACAEGARRLLREGMQAVVVTLGERGALIVDHLGTRHTEAASVSAVDTTGAGDAFVGTFATLLARGLDVDEAVEWSCKVASESVQHPGTQTSFPTLARLHAGGILVPL
jgi:ribokinase